MPEARQSSAQSSASSDAPAIPLISVIVACLDAAGTLRDCLQSVLDQQGHLSELLVMDGGSSDGTIEILSEFQARLAHFESKPDGGVYRAWNNALEHVRGEWVYFLGADDFLWGSDVFLRMSAVLRAADPKVTVVYGRVSVLDGGGKEVTVVGRPWRDSSRRFFQGGNLYHQGVFHRRGLFLNRRFDPSFRLLSDYDFLLGALSGAEPLFEPSVIIAGYRAGGMTNRPRNFALSVRETNRALRKHGYSQSARKVLLHYVGALASAALVKGASAISKRLGRYLSRQLILRAARGA